MSETRVNSIAVGPISQVGRADRPTGKFVLAIPPGKVVFGGKFFAGATAYTVSARLLCIRPGTPVGELPRMLILNYRRYKV